MKNLPLQLKKKHICYCANVMFENALSFFHTLADARNLVLSNYNGDDTGTIEVSPENILSMYSILGQRSEFLTAAIHKDLKADLLNNLTTILQGTDEDLIESANYVLTDLQKKICRS